MEDNTNVTNQSAGTESQADQTGLAKTDDIAAQVAIDDPSTPSPSPIDPSTKSNANTLDSDWFMDQMSNYNSTGRIDIDLKRGFYLDTMKSYYEDDEVRARMKKELGSDSTILFDAYYNAVAAKYRETSSDAYMERVAKATAPTNPRTNQGVSRADLLSSANIDQMMYDDYRIQFGQDTYKSAYSHRQGKTGKIVAGDGTLIYTDDHEDYDTLLNKVAEKSNGQKVIGFKYVDEQMFDGSRGGALVPVYEHDHDKSRIASKWDIMDTTRIYKDSRKWTTIIKSPLNAIISQVDNVFLETFKNIGGIIYGEDAENYSIFNMANNFSNELAAMKASQSDQASSMASIEGAANLITDVFIQLLAAKGVGLGSKSLLKSLNVTEATAGQSAAYLTRAWMTSYAAGSMSAEGRELGLTARETSAVWVAGLATLWGVNSVFNWVEEGLVEASVLKSGMQKYNKDLLKRFSLGPKTIQSLGKEVTTWKGKTMQFLKSHAEKLRQVKLSGPGAGKLAQIAGSSISETFQEMSEFIVEEIVKTGSNFTRYNSDDPDSFQGFNWYKDENYVSEYFVPGMLASGVGGAIGGGMAKSVFGGYSPQINDMMVHAILTGHESTFYDSIKKLEKNKVFGDPALSIYKSVNGDYKTIKEAEETNENPIDQNTYNRSIVEQAWNFKLKTLEILGLRGRGVNAWKAVLDKTPGVEEWVNAYQVGKELKDSYLVIDSLTDKGVTVDQIATVQDQVVGLNERYYINLADEKKKDKDEDKEEESKDKDEELTAEEVRDNEQAALEADLTNANNNITRDEGVKIVKAVQNIFDIVNGKRGERMFLKNIYQADKLKPEGQRKFELLDGHQSLNTLEGIELELEAMASKLDSNKARHSKAYRIQEQNGKLIASDKSFAEKVDGIDGTEGKIYLTQKMIQDLTSQYKGIDLLKSKLKEKVGKLQLKDFIAENHYLTILKSIKAKDQVKLKQIHQVAPDLITEQAGVYSVDVKALIQIIKDDLLTQINAITDVKDVDNLIRLVISNTGFSNHSVESSQLLQSKVIIKAQEEAVDELGEDGKAYEKLKNNISKAVAVDKKWDNTNLLHVLAEFDTEGGKFVPKNESNLVTSANILIQEASDAYNVDLDATTFDRLDEVDVLKQSIDRRLALLSFLEEADPLLGRFRKDLSEGKLVSFKYLEKFDNHLTKFNRTFERVLYNPTRKLELQKLKDDNQLSKKEQQEYDTLLAIEEGYSKSSKADRKEYTETAREYEELKLKQFEAAMAGRTPEDIESEFGEREKELQQKLSKFMSKTVKGQLLIKSAQLAKILKDRNKTLSSELAKKEKFKASIGAMQRNTLGAVEFAYSNIEGKEFSDVLTEVPEIAELHKLKPITGQSSTDSEAVEVMNAIIKVRKLLHVKFSGKLKGINMTGVGKDLSAEAHNEILNYITILGMDFGAFISGYKSYIDLQATEEEDNGIFPFPANQEQFEAAYQTAAYLVSPEVRNLIRHFYVESSSLERDLAENVSVQNMFAVIGRLGSGKTTLVGVAALHVAQEYLGSKDKSIIIAAAVDEQIDALSTIATKAGFNIYSKKLRIGKEPGNNLATFLKSKEGDTLESVSTIFVDEATYIAAFKNINTIQGADTVHTTDLDIADINGSLIKINDNRRSQGLPELNILMLGDTRQAGAVAINKSTGSKHMATIFKYDTIPQSRYLMEAERSQSVSLNKTIDETTRVLEQVGIKNIQDKSMTTYYGYDESANTILGVPTVSSMKGLLDSTINGFQGQSITEILVENLKSNPDFTVGIASDRYLTKQQLIAKFSGLTELLTGLDSEGKPFSDRVRLFTHENIQGREFDFTIVHADPVAFGTEFGATIEEAMINGRKLSTSIGRSRTGSVIVNETDFDMSENIFDPEERVVTQDNKLSKEKDLREFQNKLFTAVGQEVVVKAEPKTQVSTQETVEQEETVETDTIEVDTFFFDPVVMVDEFKRGDGFTLNSSSTIYDGSDNVHRKNLLRKAIYHITLEDTSAINAEQELLRIYVKALKQYKISPQATIAAIKADIRNTVPKQILDIHTMYYGAYKHMNSLSSSGDYILHDLYIGTNGVYQSGNYGLGMSFEITVIDNENITLPPKDLYNVITGNLESASYIFTGEVGNLTETNSLGYSLQDYKAVKFGEHTTPVLFIIENKTSNPVDFEPSLVINENAIQEDNRKLRVKFVNILKEHPSWMEVVRIESKGNEGFTKKREALESIYLDSDSTVEQKTAAMGYLQFLLSVELDELVDVPVGEFMDRLDSLGDPKVHGSEFMKKIDNEKGIVALYTESFNAMAKDGAGNEIPSGIASLAYTGSILKDAGYEVASINDKYREIIRDVLVGSRQVTKYVTYAYRAFKADGTTEYTTMMIAAEIKGKMYVLGHFNNKKTGLGKNLSKIQQVVNDAYSKNKIIGEWSNNDFKKFFNQGKSLTSGAIIKGTGKRLTLPQIIKKLQNKGLHVDPKGVRIIASYGAKHAGKAILFYSATPMGFTPTLAEDPELGMMSGDVGAILLDPEPMALEVLMQHVKAHGFMNPKEPGPFARTLTSDNIGINMTATLAELALALYKSYAYVLHSDIEATLNTIIAEASKNNAYKLWDKAKLKKVIAASKSEIEGDYTIMEATMRAVLDIMRPNYWSKNYIENGKVQFRESGTTLINYNRSNPIIYAEQVGDSPAHISFNFSTLSASIKNTIIESIGSVTIKGETIKGVQLENEIYKTLGGILSHSETFKHGIRLAPVMTSDFLNNRGVNTIMAPTVDFGSGYTADIGSISYPIMYLQASSGTANIWDSVKVAKKKAAAKKEPTHKTFTIQHEEVTDVFTLSSESLNKDFNKAIHDSGIENLLIDVDEFEVDDVLGIIYEMLDSGLGGSYTDKINAYTDKLIKQAEEVGFNSIVPVDVDSTIDNVRGNKIILKVSDVPEVDSFISHMSLISNTGKLIYTEQDKIDYVDYIKSLAKNINKLPVDDAVKRVLENVRIGIEGDIANMGLEKNPESYELGLNNLLASDLHLMPSDEYLNVTVDSSLSELLAAYFSVDISLENYEDIRESIKDMITSRDIDAYQKLVDLPTAEVDLVDAVIDANNAKGDKRVELLDSYQNLSEAFFTALEQEISVPGSTTNAYVLQAISILDILNSKNGDPIGILEASNIENIFNLKEFRVLSKDGSPTDYALDVAVISQHVGLMTRLIEMSTVTPNIKEDAIHYIKVKEDDYNIQIAKAVVPDSDKPITEMLHHIMGITTSDNNFYNNYLQGIVDTLANNTQQDSKTVVSSVNKLIKDSYLFIKGVNIDNSSQAQLKSLLTNVNTEMLNIPVEDLEVRLDKILIQKIDPKDC